MRKHVFLLVAIAMFLGINLQKVNAQMSGTYYVGTRTGDNYTTLTGAGGFFAAVNTAGINGNIVVKVTTSTTETGANALSVATGSNTITIQPIDTATVIKNLLGTYTGAMFRVSSPNVTFNGAINGAGINMMLKNSNGTYYQLQLLTGANNFTVKNCIVQGGDYQTAYGIYVAGVGLSNLTITNDSINNCKYGLYIYGTSTTPMTNLTISKTQFGTLNNNTGKRIQNYSMYLSSYINGLTIDSNTIIQQAHAASVTPRGIFLGTNVINANITRNNILRLANSDGTASSIYGAAGIEINTTNANSNINIINNLINNINGIGSITWGTYSIDGIRILGTGTGGVKIYNNTINLYGNTNQYYPTGSNQTYSSGIYIVSGATNIDIRDNIIYNTIVGTPATSKAYAIYSAAANTAFTNINYNDYYVNSANQGYLAYLPSADITTLAALKTATGKDANSLFADPIFTDSVHTSPAAGSPALAAGTPISGVTTDVIGMTRSTTSPSIGAYEAFLPCTTPAAQPTVLNLTPTATTVTGSFTASAGTPVADHYLIVRNTTGTSPSSPSNGTNYSISNQLSGSTFVSIKTTTTISDTGLTGNTHYYYFIYAVNSNCTGGPFYATGTPLTANTTTLCGTPVAQPTVLSLTPTLTSMTGSFNASATADHYIILRGTSATAPTPVNLTNYTIGTVLGSDTVIAYQTTTTFNDAGLNSGVMYYYFVFAANSICTGGPIYLTTSPLTYNIATLNNTPCVAPVNTPTNLVLTPTTTTIGGSFTATTADYYLIIRNNTGIAPATPVDTVIYANGSAYDAIGDTVIAYQLGTAFNDTRLLTGTQYYYYVYAANSICVGGPKYNPIPLFGSIFTNCITPATQPIATGNVSQGLNTITFTFTPPATAPDHYLVVRSTISTTPTIPVNLSNYNPGTSTLSTGDSVIAYQTGTTVNDINLTPSTKYYYWIYSANSNCTVGPKYLTTAPLTFRDSTTCVYPANQPSSITSLTATSSNVSSTFTASAGLPAADHYLIVRNSTGNTPTPPVDYTPYTAYMSVLSPGDSVIAYQTTTTISDIKLLPTTKYYYFIYASNNTCSGGPLYLTASPLTGNITTTGVFTSTGTWVCPANVTSVNVFLWGGGGGGGGGTYGSINLGNGGGGGGGACAVNNYVTVIPGTTYTITVGTGGIAGTSSANGGTGGMSKFENNGLGLSLYAAGGIGGTYSTGTSGASLAGGSGGNTGTGIIYSGGNGSAGYNGTSSSNSYTGTGGGGAGSGGNGTTPANGCNHTGTGGIGTYTGGTGGYNTNCSTSTDMVGVVGAFPGGGGSGDNTYNTLSEPGGAGGAGEVIISVNPQCTTPAAQPTSLTLKPASNSDTLSFLASASADHYLIVRNTSGTLNATPLNTKTYIVGDTLGSGLGTVAAYQTGTSFTDNGLNGNTHYYYYVFAANSNCGSGPLYFISSPLTGNTTTLCSTPLLQPTVLSLIPDTNKVTLSFTASASADHYLICRSTSGTFSSTIPNGFGFSNGTTFGVDTVIAYQTGTTYIDANLHPNTQYYYFVFAANSSCTGGPMYLSSSPLTNNTVTLLNIPCTAPTNPPTILSLTPGLTTMSGSYLAASGGADHYLIIRNNTNITPAVPANGTLYTAGSAYDTFGDSIVSYQVGLAFTDSRLNTSTHYYYYIYAANSTCIGGLFYYTTSSLNGNAFTNCAAPLLPATNMTFTPGYNSITASFTASATADHYLIVRSTLSTTPTAPVNAMNYFPGTSTLSTLDSVIGYQTSTTFTDVNLNPSTHYYYWVYAANSNCSGTYPMFLATTPLAANTYTNCLSPIAQPTALTLLPLATTLTGSFTASASADHYLIVRSSLNTLNTLPVNGTTYNTNDTLGGGVVAANQTTTIISDLGLTPATQYYYYIFATNSNCSGGPLYYTTLPLVGNATTFPTALNGVYTINSGQATGGTNFTSFADAVNTLNTLGVSGSVTFNVFAGQSWSALCTTSNPYGYKITRTGTAANPITFQRIGNGANPLLNITGSSATTDAGIWLYGVSYITFNGIDIVDLGSSSTNWLDYGIYLYSGSATSGCLYNTFKNSTITLNRSNTYSYLIYGGSVATQLSGSNSYNTFQNLTLQKAYRGIYLQGASASYDRANSINNIVVDSIGVSAGSTGYGIYFGYQDSCNVTFNRVSALTGTTTYGIYPYYSKNFTIQGDTIRNLYNASVTTYGIYQVYSDGNNTISNNVLSTFSGVGGVNGYYRYYGTSTNQVYQNIITNLTSAGGTVYGMIFGYGTANDYCYKNKVFNLSYTGVSTYFAIGIATIGSATTHNLYAYNNFISDIRATTSTSTTPSCGFYFVAGNTRLYNNTAYMDYISASSSNNSAALYSNLTYATLDARNNILINKCNINTGLKAVAFWWSATPYTNLATTTNNNLLYAGTPSSKNLIFYDATNSDQTLAAYQSHVAPRDAIAFTEDVPFVNTTTLPYDLHINPITVTNVESHGQRITTPIAITTDIDGDIRWGETGYTGTGTAPDLGADEYNHILPCAAPANAPTSLTLAPVVTTISCHFTPSPNADHYLIVRNTTGTNPSAPVTGTTYSSGNQLSGSTFVGYQTDTTFTDNGLVGNTQYYYYVYAANAVNCTNGPAYLTTTLLTGNATTNCAAPSAQPTDILLAPGTTTVNGSFTVSTSADHYLVVRSTNSTLSAAPLNGTIYNPSDLLGGGVVLGYQSGTSISDQGLLWNTQYYYFVFAANSICTGGPVYYTTFPLTGNATTLPPPVTNKTLKVTAMLQEYYNTSTGLMNQTLGINWDTGDLFKNFSGTTVDTVMVLIRKTNITADVVSSFPIDTIFYGVSLNNNGLITISLSAGITGYHYIEIKHRNSIETWSDSVNFSTDTVKYDFYNYVSQFAMDNGMLQDGIHAWIWGGDVNQNGNLESEDATIIYVAANSDDPTVNNGYVICDIDGNGNLDSQDYGLAYNNANIGANIINPFSYLKKK